MEYGAREAQRAPRGGAGLGELPNRHRRDPGGRGGAVIHVQPGTYQEGLVIDTDITVVAEKGPGTVRIVAGHGPAVSVSGGAPVFRGVTFQGTNRGSAVLVTAGAPVFDECEVHGGRVDVIHTAAATLRTCVLEGSKRLQPPRDGYGDCGR